MPILSSVLIGSSLGIFRKVAQAQTRASYRFPTAFIFFVQLAMVFITPSLKFPSLTMHIKELGEDPEMETAYYDSRGLAVAVFFGTGLLITLIFFTVFNAV
mmetsp:Transcript_2453/g.3393  ORF Transcript_2453/g.3393 Transcript_2453/m.3393 type:complete len:101 (+) Transcript_2453:512-814(+)